MTDSNTPLRRVLVTGSRDWTDYEAVWDALEIQLNLTVGPNPRIIIVHGACPTGADRAAATWTDPLSTGLALEEAHPADWSLGRKAGPLRNQEMVDLGADVCLAFPLANSRGTRDCMNRALAARIPVIVNGKRIHGGDA